MINVPHDIQESARPAFNYLLKSVAVLRNIIRSCRSDREVQLTRQQIEYYENLRCDNFATDKKAFISSALNRSKRSIILDRAMGLAPDGSETLLTEPADIKTRVNNHF